MDLNQWFAGPLGKRCLENERAIVSDLLDRVFGETLVQIGSWGTRDSFLPFARTQRSVLIGDGSAGCDIASAHDPLAVASDSIDAVLLPHTLERTRSAHGLLREVARVLRGDGRLIILGFRPGGLWGLRHLFDPLGFPPGSRRLITDGKLQDWLELLSFDVENAAGFCHAFPVDRLPRLAEFPNEQWARKWLPFFAAGYALVAQKRVVRMTPVRPTWKERRLRVVQGLVEPTTRASRTRGSSS